MKRNVEELIEEACALSEELINMALVQGGPCIKKEVLINCDLILEKLDLLKSLID